MTSDNSSHPPGVVLTAFGLGRLSGTARQRVEHHIATCPRCGSRLETVADDSFIILLREAAREPTGPETLTAEQRSSFARPPGTEVPAEPAD